MAKKKNNTLPAYTTVENVLSLIDVLKKNNKNEESIKALFGKADSAYGNSKSALKTFGIIENGNFEFTKIGREIAFSGEDDKKEAITKIIKNYEPYELVLNSITTPRSEIDVTDIDTIKNLWGKAGFGSTDRNRNDGATLFMSIIDFVELGKYITGRGSNPTRIEWVTNICEKINTLLQEKSEDEPQDIEPDEIIEEEEKFIEHEVKETLPALTIDSSAKNKVTDRTINTVGLPNITIKVDMSDWSDEKIKVFFKYAYGKFEEE